MMFKSSALVVVLASLVVSFAAAQVTICRVTSDEGDRVATFQTKDITDAEYSNYINQDIMDGPCADWLGELCDDNDFCTIDYDEETHTCLEFPREVVSDCESPF